MQEHPKAAVAAIAGLIAIGSLAWGCSTDEDTKPGDGTTADGGDASTPPPLTGTPGEWTWVDVPESQCANGEPTGVGVNIGTSKELVIFLEGGGACWDEYFCLTLKTASFIDGFQRPEWDATLAGAMPGLDKGGMFDRTAPTNPYREASFVYIPYCTADVHAGDATQQLSTRAMHYAGRRNVEAFLSKIVPSFPDASRVTLTGRSAGGFGAAINFWRVKKAFGDTRVDLLDDSGPPFEQSTIAMFSTWRDTWDLAGALPPDCAECQTNVRAALPYYSRTYPGSRFGLLSYDQDSVISQFYFQSGAQFQTNLKDLTENTIAPLPNARFFVVTGTKHTMVDSYTVTSEGKSVGDWVADFANDAPAWSNVSPL